MEAKMALGQIPNVVKKEVRGQVYYFGTIDSDKIKNVTYVPVIESSKMTYLQEKVEEGYQRPGSRTRMRQFMRYLRDNPNTVIPPILLSGRDQWKFVKNSDSEYYGQIIIEDSATIIDAQHRVDCYLSLFEQQ